MAIEAGPAGNARSTVKVAVSAFTSCVTRAGCVWPPAVIDTSPKAISAACSVTSVVGFSTVTRIVSRPRNVALSRSGANHSV